jgi:hypothetical protein
MTNFVICPACDETHEPEEVNALNVEEDLKGRDVLTFECPYSNTIQKSLVWGNS